MKEYVFSSCTKGSPFIYIYSNPLGRGCKVFFNKQLHFKRPWHSVRTARHAFCKFPWKRCDNFYSCERRVALWQEWRINALALVVQKRRSMPRGTSSALETLLLVLLCTLCKGTAKLLRKKKQPLLCASDLGAGYSGVPTHPTLSLPGVNLGNHTDSSGTCPNASKKNSLGKFILKSSHLAAWQKGCARAWAADGRAPGRFQKHWKGHFGQPRRHQEN